MDQVSGDGHTVDVGPDVSSEAADAFTMGTWSSEPEVDCVVCPSCAFTFDADHTDYDNGYSCPLCELTAIAGEVERLTTEHDLAVAHDTQPYPTAWAYKQAVKTVERLHGVIEATTAERDEARRLAERWSDDAARQRSFRIRLALPWEVESP